MKAAALRNIFGLLAAIVIIFRLKSENAKKKKIIIFSNFSSLICWTYLLIHVTNQHHIVSLKTQYGTEMKKSRYKEKLTVF